MLTILVKIAIVALLIISVIWAPVFIMKNDVCRDQVIECLVSSEKNTPVCGTDGISYPSICQVISKECGGEPVTVNYVGPCKDKTPCFTAFRRASPFLQPTCNPDGTFAPIQCHLPSSYCWCVTPAGDRLQETLTQYRKPVCPPYNNNSIYTHSALFKRNLSPTPTPHWPRQSSCTQKNYHQFTKNLLKTFEIEYNRTKSSTTIITKDTIINWKFNHLDTNADGHLDESEYDVLVRLAEKGVKPTKCARILPRVCDVTNDMNISLNEWSTCLRNSTSDLLRRHTRGKIDFPLSGGEKPWVSAGNNCSARRAAALEYQNKTGQNSLVIPDCTDGGVYQSVQCYAGLCWCVDEKDAPIAGSLTKGGRPDCQGPDPVPGLVPTSVPDAEPAPVPESVPLERFMKGCSSGRLDDLTRKMKEIMMSKLKNSREGGSGRNEEERAATWMFSYLDLNKNNVLQRGNEWRSIRALVPNNRCATKFPRFCDVNEDDKISIEEWFRCLNIVEREGNSVEEEELINPLHILH